MLYFTKIRDVKSPTRGTSVSSGLDFYIPNSLIPEDVSFTPKEGLTVKKLNSREFVKPDKKQIVIQAGYGVLIPSGLKVLLPEGEENYTYEMVLYNKSGVAVKHNLIVGANVIDNDYRGEFNIHLINCSNEDVYLEFGQKMVQGIVRRVYLEQPEEISFETYEASSNTERGEGGFGSTGTK